MAFLQFNFQSEVLGMSTTVNVVLPDEAVAGKKEEPVPVLTLLHGMSDDENTWIRRTSVDRYARDLGYALVTPTTHLGWYTDMAHGMRYRTFIGEELPAVIRRVFPMLSSARRDNWISGNSMGGYGSLMIALDYPESFSVAAPLSGAFTPDLFHSEESTYFPDIFGPISEYHGSPNDVYHRLGVLRDSGSPLPKIYVGCGRDDFLIEANRAMRDRLGELGYDFVYSETEGEHNWSYWDREIQSVLRYIESKRKEL